MTIEHHHNRIRVLVVEDHPVARRGLSMLLESFDSIALVAEASNASQALQVMRRFPADLVILDINLPDLNGIDLIQQLNGEFPHAKILMLSASKQPRDISRALAAGAVGYCHKGAEMDRCLSRAIRILTDGHYWLDSMAATQLGSLCTIDAAHDHTFFDETECQMLNAIAEKRCDFTESCNQQTMASIVAKLRNEKAA